MGEKDALTYRADILCHVAFGCQVSIWVVVDR